MSDIALELKQLRLRVMVAAWADLVEQSARRAGGRTLVA